MADNPSNFDVILRLMLDEASRVKFEQGLLHQSRAIDKLEKRQPMRRQLQMFDQAEMLGGVPISPQAQKAALAAFHAENAARLRDMELLNTQIALSGKKGKEALQSYATGLQKWGSGLRDLTRDFRGIFVASTKLNDLSRALLAVGTVGFIGMFALANKYIQSVERATDVTQDWKIAIQDISKAGNRIGESLARAALPLLERAARITEAIADFMEAHPNLATHAVRTSVLLFGLGVIANAVSKGIKLVVSAAYLAAVAEEALAARLMNIAADKQLAAAGIMNAGGAIPLHWKAAKAWLIDAAIVLQKGLITFFTGTFGTILAGILSGVLIHDVAARATGGATSTEIFKKGLFILLSKSTQASVEQGNITPERRMEKLKKLLDTLGLSAEVAAVRLEQFKGTILGLTDDQQKQVVEMYTNFRETELAEERKTHDARLKILEDANEAMLAEDRQFSEAMRSARAEAQQAQLDAVLAAEREWVAEEANIARERANILRDAGIEIARIEQDSQERLRKMKLEHEDRMFDLIAARDAFGIFQEQRNYRREVAEERRATNIEIARRRQDLAIRLADLEANFQAERAAKQAELARELVRIQNEEKAKLEELTKAHLEEQKAIALEEKKKLADLEKTAQAERIARRNAFLRSIADLNLNLLDEYQLKHEYYLLMLKDAEDFLKAWRGNFQYPGLPVNGSSAVGGYVNNGLWQMHDREFVLNRNTTSAAERVIAGPLNQSNVLAALGRGSGDTYVTVHQQLRFDGEISVSDKREVRRIAREAAEESMLQVIRKGRRS